jgi:hypothetical protein
MLISERLSGLICIKIRIQIERIFKMMTEDEARAFASSWLPAWTGNDPEKLADFYSER